MSISHHPSAGMLTAYAAGTLGEGPSLLIAAHLTLCPECRAAVQEAERVGGGLLDSLPTEQTPITVPDSLLASLDSLPLDGPETDRADRSVIAEDLSALPPVARRFPKPLRDRMSYGAELPWRMLGPGVRQIDLGSTMPHNRVGHRSENGAVRLFHLQPGTPMPQHDHGGSELTLVLEGGFSDQAGHYVRGDVAEAEPGIVHAPVVDTDGPCICLIATEGRLRYTGLVGRVMQRFTGI
ncbi:MAG: ChrR family anti-sigma-E factor [Rhodospirillaceae bacterium]